MSKRAVILMSIFLFGVGAGTCWRVQPYENIPQPQGVLLELFPVYYTASRLNDKSGTAVSTNMGLKLYEVVSTVLYYNQSLFKNSIVAGVNVPSGYTELLGDHDAGIGDLSLVAGYWLIDDPASQTWLGAGSYLDAPTGSFKKQKSTNMGTNVWKVRPTIVLSKLFGPVDLELTTKYNIYSKNRDTDGRQGNEMISEGYIGYQIQPGLTLGTHLNATFGSDSVSAGAKVRDSGVRTFQAGASVLKMFGPVSVTVGWLSDFAVRNSVEGYQIVARICWKP